MRHGLSKTAGHERISLRANSVNAVGLAFGVAGIIQPAIAGDLLLAAAAKAVLCSAVGFILPRYAVEYLECLED